MEAASINMDKPRILVFAGPNGSGKSTITKGYPTVGMYIKDAERESVLPNEFWNEHVIRSLLGKK